MKKKFGYKSKDVIISLFNESQSYFIQYADLLEGNKEEAQKRLNTAGNKLQQSYELGLKHYLDKRYKELYEKKIISHKEYIALVRIIENGKQINGNMVNLKYLSEQMNIYAIPNKQNTSINFDLIKKNINPIYNDNKHIGNDVDSNIFRESYNEIRKFIIEYIDSNPEINFTRPTEYVNLQNECEYWDETQRYNFCLICDKINLDDSAKRRLLFIKWSLIIDFDINTREDGLFKAYVNEYGIESNSFDISSPKNSCFNSVSKSPYWFHINGIKDFPESLVESDRRWRQKYGSILSECLCKYREVFSKPLKVIIMSGEAKKIKEILNTFDAIYEDSLKIYLLSQEVQFEEIVEDYKEILKKFPLSEVDFSQGIKNFSSFFNKHDFKQGHFVYGREGKVEVQLEDYSCFEIPYLGIEDEEKDDDNKNCELFYQGANLLSWYGVKNGFAIDRIAQFRNIKHNIIKSSKETSSKIIRLNHDPGAGGTTLSRMIAFDLSKDIPVLLLRSYDEKNTSIQVANYYRLVEMSILIVVESSVISDDDLKKLNGELMAQAIPHVFLLVSRFKREHNSHDGDLRLLIDDEFNEMVKKLDPYLTDEKKHEVNKLLKSPEDRYPFFMSMYTFEEKFRGVKNYIENYFFSISKNDRLVLEYISLVDWFANRELDISFFKISDDSTKMFENPVNYNLIRIQNLGQNSSVRMRHPRFAEEIISQRISESVNDRELAKAENLSKFLSDFIEYSKQNIMFDLNSTIDVLKNLLILRDPDSLINSKFAPVIEYMKSLIPNDVGENEKYNCIGLVFKKLVNTYMEEPHFKAHLSRYYSNIEKNYEMGIQEAKAAVFLSENLGEYDSILYHIYGMSIRKYIEQKLYKEAKECKEHNDNSLLSKICDNLEEASKQFEKVRETNNKVAGYISDIEMCISVVDFGKELYGCSTEDFIKQHRESWFMKYYDRALTLLEGFRSIQVEEDTEFYKVKLSAKCAISLQDMIHNIESTIKMWQEYLSKAEDLQKPVVRRFIARAKEKNYFSTGSNKTDSVKQVMQLMEDNINQEPKNGANIRIWFNALRRFEGNDDDILLDEALQKLSLWKDMGDNLEAYYYYFILICIKAIEGSSRAEANIPDLQEELKTKTYHMPNNRVIYEWLGKGKGVHRLINAVEQKNGKYHRKPLDYIENEGCYLEGRLSKYKHERSAQIKSHNMEVFFSPSGQNKQCSTEDINKKVKFILGFSYDGLRALNKSVQLFDYKGDDNETLIGKTVKCTVIGTDREGNFLKVKFFDYRNTVGSIHKKELPEDKNVYDYAKGETIFAKVIDRKYLEKEGKIYYKLRMKEEELDGWQRELKEKFSKNT